MASYKTGLDYYSHYIGMTRDKKLRKARMEFGSVAVDVWLALLDMIYSDKGYFLTYSDLTKDDVIWEVLDYVKGNYSPSSETVAGIIECLVACGLFSDDLFKHGILSSKRIQATYYAGTVERKAVEVKPDIWLLTIEKMKSISERSPILRQFENQPKIGHNQPICEDNQPNMEQSIVNESIGKDSKVQYVDSATSALPTATAPQNRDSLIERFGEENVDKSEKKYDTWKAKKGGNVKGNRYETILKMMNEDGIKKPVSHSSFDFDEFQEQLHQRYKNSGRSGNNV